MLVPRRLSRARRTAARRAARKCDQLDHKERCQAWLKKVEARQKASLTREPISLLHAALFAVFEAQRSQFLSLGESPAVRVKQHRVSQCLW